MKGCGETGCGRRSSALDGRKAGNGRPLLVIPLLALFLVHPLIVHGCSCGHDFDFHLVSWFEAATQMAHGNLHPHWAFTPAWDAGEPRFVFYPPLSWYLGALLGLVLTHLPHMSEAAGWTAAPLMFTWTALSLSGLTMFRLARRYVGANVALIAAAIYMANPYMMFTAVERTAYGELLAAAWMPLLLDGILREEITVPRIAVPVALLWLTNAPAAVMGCYALVLLATVRVATEWRQNGRASASFAAMKTVCGTVLGLALAAFYIVPAAHERRYVQAAMAIIGGTKIDANFLFEHTGTTQDDLMHDAVLRVASCIAVLMLVATVAALLAAWRRSRLHSGTGTKSSLDLPQQTLPPSPMLLLAVLTAAIAFLLTPLSAPLWHHTPEMAFLQFPWRLLALLAPVLALTISAALRGWRICASHTASATLSNGSLLAALLVAAALGLPAWHLFRQPYDAEDTAPARLALFHSNAGTDPTDEYTPTGADNDVLAPNGSAWWLADSPDSAAPVHDTDPAVRTAPMHLTFDTPHAEFLVLNLRDYPAWQITLAPDGAAAQLVTTRMPRADGLIALPVPVGRSTMSIHYAQTADQTAGDAISVLAVLLLAAAAIRRRSSPAAA